MIEAGPLPSSVPADLTRPSAAYQRHAYLAVAGLLTFLSLYFGLAAWFTWTSYRLLSHLGDNRGSWLGFLAGGVAAGFLAIFMLKALVFVRRGSDRGTLELAPADHPRLFAFLHQVADQAGAPRPHRVYLSPRVNAAVFYDLSIANLVLPTRKNLEIGLGLVNALTLGEVRAVLAHEFGHFAQRTMAVGRWVYMAQQIAGHIVARRDALDSFLHGLSRQDVRIAWIGWVLRVVVWSIRSLVDTLFGWVVLAERALSREMEFQADLVAVSLTGSDALIHALHKLGPADDALDGAFAFAGDQKRAGKRVADLFAIQSHVLERKRAIFADPLYGQVPAVPADDPAAHRVFKARFAQPPRMWSTHPPSEEREANAKRRYVPAAIDERSAWTLFDDPQQVRADVTALLYRRDPDDKKASDEPVLETTPIEESIARLDQSFKHRYLDPSYRGAYLGRSVVLHADKVAELYGPAPDDLGSALQGLYPATLSQDLERMRELSQDRAMLRALERGILEAPGGVVRYRGQEHHRRELPTLLSAVDRELEEARAAVHDHDRLVRSVHLAAARTLSPEWEAYLRGLAAVVHYAEHREADLDDAHGCLGNVIAIVTADRHVSSDEVDRIVIEAGEVFSVLAATYVQADEVDLGPTLRARLEVESWKAALGELGLNPPHDENVQDWLTVAPSWINGTSSALSALGGAALDELVRAEEEVALYVTSGQPAPPAPAAPRVPARYQTRPAGKERWRQTRLDWWDRFQVADGLVAGAVRFAAAAAVVGGVVWGGCAVSKASVYVVNGLSRPVTVEIGDASITVPPRDHAELRVAGGDQPVVARTERGEIIERFTADVDDSLGQYVYNVARAAPLDEWDPRTDTTRELGAPRWAATEAGRVADDPDHVVANDRDAPVLIQYSRVDAIRIFGRTPEADRPSLIASHARWEPAHAVNTVVWLNATPEAELAALVDARVAADSGDILARRVQQEVGDHDAVCAAHRAAAERAKDDADLAYLAARCIDDEDDRDQAFLELADRYPDNPWLAMASGATLAQRADYGDALVRYEAAFAGLPELRIVLGEDLIRLRRIVGHDGPPFPGHIVDDAPQLALHRAIESEELPPADQRDPLLMAARELHVGLLGPAADRASGETGAWRILVPAAASDGASAELVARALDIPPAVLDASAALYAAALALREGRDAAPFLAVVDEADPDQAAALRGFLDAVRGSAIGSATAAAEQLDLETRARAYAAAAVILGDGCPPAWRDVARKALFGGERPYLK